jgi:hypothetical protein
MTKTKSELTLNPDYYSAHAYMVEETEETISIKMVLKLFITIVVIGALILVYNFYIKNNLTSIGLWLSEVKQIVMFEDKKAIIKKPIIIREETFVTPNKLELVKEQIPKVKEIKEEVSQIIKPKSVKSDTLTDEYIKLMQKSLVNY